MAENVNPMWRDALGKLLTVGEVAALGGLDEQSIERQVDAGELLALATTGGQLLLPAFQFGADGRSLPSLGELIRQLNSVVVTPFTTAAWLVAPEPLLAGKSAVQWLRDGGDPNAAVEAARRQARRLAQ